MMLRESRISTYEETLQVNFNSASVHYPLTTKRATKGGYRSIFEVTNYPPLTPGNF